MDLDQIRTFVALARGRSFVGAAATLHRSQPAISRRIELLEREFDTSLFERLRSGTVLTAAGAAFLPHAEAVLAAARDGAEALRAVGRGDSGQVSLALVGTLANVTLTDVLQQFGRKYPKVRLDLQTAISREVDELVQRGEATLGLRYATGRQSGVVSQIIAEERLVVVGRPDHPLANGRTQLPSRLANEKWVAFPMRNARESFAQFLARKLLAAGLEDAEIIPIDSLTAQKRLVEAGFGVALLAESGIQEELKLGTLKILNVPALRASIPITIVHRRNGYLSPAADSLMSMMRASWHRSARRAMTRKCDARRHSQQPTLCELPVGSVWVHKPTSRVCPELVRFTPKADISRRRSDVGFGPFAEVAIIAFSRPLSIPKISRVASARAVRTLLTPFAISQEVCCDGPLNLPT